MKRRTLLRLIVSLLLIAAFVIGATIVEANNSLNPTAWFWAQRQLSVLWVVDAFALLALVPVCGFASAQNRLYRRAEETARARDEHQAQLERMRLNVESADRRSKEQIDLITTLQDTLAALTARLETMETDGQARQQALEAEARRLAEQAFDALNGQVEANTRQMEAVNLAMQYQRAEIKQLRQGVRVVQRHQELFHVAQLTPAELAAIENITEFETPQIEGQSAVKSIAGAGEGDSVDLPQATNNTPLVESIAAAGEGEESDASLVSTGAGEPGFFAPTMNGQATFVSAPTAYTIAPPQSAPSLNEEALNEEALNEEAAHYETAVCEGRKEHLQQAETVEAAESEKRRQDASEQFSGNAEMANADIPHLSPASDRQPRRTANGAANSVEESENSTSPNLHVTEEEYRWLTGANAVPLTPASPADSLPPTEEEQSAASSALPSSTRPARRWRLRL